jgi:sulfoquinovose isomerase
LLGGPATKDGWRLAEHFAADWTPDHEYNAENPDNEFRPYGSTIGHWLEWARLLVLLHAYDPRRRQWMVDAADSLFDHAVTEGWEPDGGFAFTVDWDGRPLSRDRYHWVVAEAIGAACALHQRTRRDDCRDWYQRFWAYADQYLIDHDRGGWRHQLDPDHQPIDTVWTGKPDLYHALQATLFARVPLDVGLAVALRDGRLDDVSPPSPR